MCSSPCLRFFNRENDYSQEIAQTLKERQKPRWARMLMYFCLSLGGLMSQIAPSQILLDQSSSTLSSIWSFCFVIAAFVCFLGAIFDRWIAEYVMIPLLASTLFLFGTALLTESISADSLITVPYGLFFLAYGFGLITRWRDIQLLANSSTHYEGAL